MRLYWGLRLAGNGDYPYALRWTTSLKISGTFSLSGEGRLMASLLSPCCSARLVQKSSPPYCTACECSWEVFTLADEEWREYFLPRRWKEVGDELQSWLAVPIEALHGHLAAQVFAPTLLDGFQKIRLFHSFMRLNDMAPEAFEAYARNLSGRLL